MSIPSIAERLMTADGDPSPSDEGRADALRRLLESRPEDPRLLFGLALEHLNAGRTEEGVRLLRRYLSVADDEGNAWGRLGHALLELDRPVEAREAFARGVEVARNHGHPTLAAELDAVISEQETSTGGNPEGAE